LIKGFKDYPDIILILSLKKSFNQANQGSDKPPHLSLSHSAHLMSLGGEERGGTTREGWLPLYSPHPCLRQAGPAPLLGGEGSKAFKIPS